MEELPAHEGLDSSRDGHATVIVEQRGNIWKIKNSWGSAFADNGYFKLKQGILGEAKYFDVFFAEGDLTYDDRKAFMSQCLEQNA